MVVVGKPGTEPFVVRRQASPLGPCECHITLVATPVRMVCLTYAVRHLQPVQDAPDILLPVPYYTYRPVTVLGIPVPLASHGGP